MGRSTASRGSLVFLALASTMGCAGTSKPTSSTDETTPTSESPRSSSNETDPPVDVAPPQASITPTPGSPSEHELSFGDCQALGGKYRDLTMSDQLAKLSPSVTQAQREQARTSVEKAAVIVAEKWTASCEGSLVGKFTDESWLTCAMSSKTVAAFDQCLNGGPPK